MYIAPHKSFRDSAIYDILCYCCIRIILLNYLLLARNNERSGRHHLLQLVMASQFNNLLKRFSLSKVMEYLVCGYIKQNATKMQYSLYPFGVQEMSMKYLGNHFFIRFNAALTDTSKIELINEYHARIPLDAPFWSEANINYVVSTILIDCPIPTKDDSFKIKMNLKISTLGKLRNGHHFIGIVPESFNYFGQTLLMADWESNTSHVYGRCGVNGIWGFWNGTLINNKKRLKPKYGECGPQSLEEMNNKIICMEYDGELKQLKLSNFETGKLIFSFKIDCSDANVKYHYPAISLRDRNDSVQIV